MYLCKPNHTLMKKFVILCLGLALCLNSYAQDCIDAIVVSKQGVLDTIPCKILGATDLYYTIDYGNQISSVVKESVVDTLSCFRTMSLYEIQRFMGLDAVSGYDLDKSGVMTGGKYLKKATYNFYTGVGITTVGALGIGLGTSVFAGKRSQNYWIISGGIATGAGIFFLLKACHHIYQAGKLLDLERATLYLAPTDKGDLGLILKF